jgi:hypothetical protein
MTDYLDWGASWLSEQAKEHASQEVVLKWTVNGVVTTATLQASLVDEEGRIIRGPVKAVTENTYFMFTTADLEGTQIPLERGVQILWNSNEYDIVIGRNRMATANDTHQYTTVIAAKHVLSRDRS